MGSSSSDEAGLPPFYTNSNRRKWRRWVVEVNNYDWTGQNLHLVTTSCTVVSNGPPALVINLLRAHAYKKYSMLRACRMAQYVAAPGDIPYTPDTRAGIV